MTRRTWRRRPEFRAWWRFPYTVYLYSKIACRLVLQCPACRVNCGDASRRHSTEPAVMTATIHPACAAFRALHESGCFILPNPWDAGSARFLQSLGFKALATTSSGMAWSRARPDGGASLDTVLAHLRTMVAATPLPLNADFENGYADDAEGVACNVRLAVETGVAGLSIEDATGDAARPQYSLHVAVQRLQAARSAIDAAGTGTLLVGRA